MGDAMDSDAEDAGRLLPGDDGADDDGPREEGAAAEVTESGR